MWRFADPMLLAPALACFACQTSPSSAGEEISGGWRKDWSINMMAPVTRNESARLKMGQSKLPMMKCRKSRTAAAGSVALGSSRRAVRGDHRGYPEFLR